ncbi:hypothetical protein YC2023_108569 [Brassica napus]
MGCLFSTHRTSVGVRQRTQHVCGCLWLSVSIHRTSVAVRVCLWVSASTQDIRSCLWLSVNTHRTSVCVCQHTQDVRVCPCVPIRTHRTSVAVHHTHMTSVGVLKHTQDVRVGPTHINTLVLGLSTLTLPVDCSGDFGPRGLSIQYTQDVRGCLPANTVRPWLSVCVRVCPCVSASTQRTSVAVHQYTYQHVGPWSRHAGPSRGLFG